MKHLVLLECKLLHGNRLSLPICDVCTTGRLMLFAVQFRHTLGRSPSGNFVVLRKWLSPICGFAVVVLTRSGRALYLVACMLCCYIQRTCASSQLYMSVYTCRYSTLCVYAWIWLDTRNFAIFAAHLRLNIEFCTVRCSCSAHSLLWMTFCRVPVA